MRSVLLIGALTVAIAAAGGAWWLLAQEPLGPRIDAGDAEQVALGATVYAAHCASCHGEKLEGQPDWRERKPDGRLPAPPHDESGHTWHHADSVLFNVTKNGTAAYVSPDYQTDMAGYAGVLSDEEIAATIAFIKSTWPEHVRSFQAEVDDADRASDPPAP